MTSLKFEIETWAKALDAYDSEEFEQALDHFSKIADNSKILTNIGLIYATLGEHELAIENFRGATELDSYLAIAYFQAGVSNFLLGQFEAAYEDFDGAYDLLRGNQTIDYDQIGLKYQLHACSVLFNQGITAIRYGDADRGMELLRLASSGKVTEDHDVIDDAIRDRGEDYSVFSVPPGTLYRPNEKKVANMQAKDWMGKAKLISTTTENPADFAPRIAAPRETPQSAPPLQRRPTVLDTAPVAAPLARSRSATATGGAGRRVEPAMERLERSASASAATPAIMETLKPVQPLALTRQKSMRAIESGPAPAPGRGGNNAARAVSPPQRRPTLAERDLPPSPPRSETRSPPVRDTNTDIYDDYYLQTDDRTEVPLLPRKPTVSRGQNLQRSNTNRSPPSAAPAVLRRQVASSVATRDQLGTFDFELKRIRVKLFFKEEARGMVIAPSTSFSEFLEMVCAKFSYEYGGLRLKFEDEDGTRVSLRDEGDWDMAVEMARDASAMGGSTAGSSVGKPGEGRLMVWCEEDYQ